MEALVELLTISWQGITSNRLRSCLTILGIIIGIASVITLLAIGQGAKTEAENRVKSLGVNLIYVWPGHTRKGNVSAGRGTAPTLTYEDGIAIKEICSAVDDVASICRISLQAQYKEKNTLTAVLATDASFPSVRNCYPAKGRFFSHQDLKNNARVCVLGDTVRDDLFGDQNPVGNQILIRGELFQVIGLMEKRGSSHGRDLDDQIYIPISTGYITLMGVSTVTGKYVSFMLVKSKDGQDWQAHFQIKNLLRLRHNIKNPEYDDFGMRAQMDIMQTAQSITGVFSILLGSTSAISLLVGGIGIMNIMLVSVTERTREIGVRKALGAKYKQILSQFVTEAILISLTGGILGILLGVGGSKALTHFTEWPTIVTPFSVIVSFWVSLFIGLFFGIYPAQKAAKLDPIDALRSE